MQRTAPRPTKNYPVSLLRNPVLCLCITIMIYYKYIMLNEKVRFRMTGKDDSVLLILMLAIIAKQSQNFSGWKNWHLLFSRHRPWQFIMACGFPTFSYVEIQTSFIFLLHHFFTLRILCIQPLDEGKDTFVFENPKLRIDTNYCYSYSTGRN